MLVELEEFIDAAILQGSTHGIGTLTRERRAVYLISEAEVLCDMEGIDSFLKHYAPNWICETADAFRRIGAKEIAEGFSVLGASEHPCGLLMDRVNKLVTGRVGYDSDDLAKLLPITLK